MKATVESINTVQRRIHIYIPSDEVAKAFTSIYKKIQKTSNMRGFRPGKTPLSVIKRSHKTPASIEAGEKIINDFLFTAIEENKVRPIATPFVETTNHPIEGSDYDFTVLIDVMPVIEIKDFRGLVVTANEYSIGKDSVERELKVCARHAAKTSVLPDDATAKIGVLATISHTATVDGKILDSLKVEKIPVALGTNEVFPELESGIEGMARDEIKKITITLPNNYGEKNLANKEVEFTVTLHEVMKLDVPPIDDELAKDMNFDTLDALKEEIKEMFTAKAEDMRKKDLESALLLALRQQNQFEIPPAMVEQVTDTLIRNMGISDKKMLKQALDDKKLRESLRDDAKTQAHNTIILLEIAKKEDIKVEDQSVRSFIEQYAREDTSINLGQIDKIMSSAGDQIREDIMRQRALDLVAKVVSITNVPNEI